MEVIDFVKNMISLGTLPAYVSLLCIGIFAFLVIWHMFRGYRRGAVKQIVHVLFVAASAVLAFLGTTIISGVLLSFLDGRAFDEIAALIEENFGITIPESISSVLQSFDLQVFEHILMLPLGVVILPVIFMVLFFVINAILKLVYPIVAGILKIFDGGNTLSKIIGLVVGAIEGALVATLILLPVAGVSGIAEDAYDMIVETNEERGFEETEAEKVFCEYIKPFSDNPVLNVVDKLGSSTILDTLATFEDGDVELNMRHEVSSIVRFAFVDIPALKDTDWFALTEEDKIIVDDVVDFVSESEYKASIVAELLCAMDRVAGLVGDSQTDGSADVIVALFHIFEDMDREDLPEVLNTFKDFYFLASDEQILSGFASGDRSHLTDAFTKTDAEGKTALDKMVTILNSNERTAPLVTTLTKMTITVLSNSMGLDDDAIAKYNDIKGQLNTTISSIDKTKTEEEQIADVSASLTEIFEKNGMTVEEGATDIMAKDIVENYADLGDVSDADFDSIMLNYYQANKDSLGGSAE